MTIIEAVAQAKADMERIGTDLLSPCGAYSITERAIVLLGGAKAGYGALRKPTGNGCRGRAVDIIVVQRFTSQGMDATHQIREMVAKIREDNNLPASHVPAYLDVYDVLGSAETENRPQQLYVGQEPDISRFIDVEDENVGPIPIPPQPEPPVPQPPHISLPDRGQFFVAAQWLDGFYRSELGLQRPHGLCFTDFTVDWEGVAAWLFDVYLRDRLAGISHDDAIQHVRTEIEKSDEWRNKHKG